MVPKLRRQKHILDKITGSKSLTAFGSTIIISLLLLFNTHYFNPTALAQRTTPRSNETQSLDEGTTTTTSESQSQNQNENENLNSEVTTTPTATSQTP